MRRVACSSSGSGDSSDPQPSEFRRAFQSSEPGRSNAHPEDSARGEPPPRDVDNYTVLGSELSPYAQQRLAGAGPSDLRPGVEAAEAALDVEVAQWPRLGRSASGGWTLHPGFLLLLAAALPPDVLLSTPWERVVIVAWAVGIATVATAGWQTLAAQNWNLAAILAVCWARGKLGPGRLLAIAALAWFGKLWMYWVFFVGARIDELLMRIAPGIRRVAWLFFAAWLLFVALTPLHTYPLPWMPFAPGNSPLRGLGLLRV